MSKLDNCLPKLSNYDSAALDQKTLHKESDSDCLFRAHCQSQRLQSFGTAYEYGGKHNKRPINTRLESLRLPHPITQHRSPPFTTLESGRKLQLQGPLVTTYPRCPRELSYALSLVPLPLLERARS